MEWISNNNNDDSNNNDDKNNSTGSASVSGASDRKNRKPQTSQQLNRENIQHLVERLEAGRSEILTAYLRAMARFRNYSFGNILPSPEPSPTLRMSLASARGTNLGGS